MNPTKSINLLGTKLSLCDKNGIFSIIDRVISENQKILITSGNVHAYNLAYKEKWLRDFYNSADVMRLDGAGVRIGAKILGHSTPKRMTWADFGWELAEFCQSRSYSLFLLGTEHQILEKAEDNLTEKYPELRIVGKYHGFFDKSPESSENERVVKMIQNTSPDILLVGFGMPLQEEWIKGNYKRLPAHIIFTVGAAFDYISGELKRPPKLLTDHGLEWLGRMLLEPQRLWKRYVLGNPIFIIRILLQRLGLLNVDTSKPA